MPLSDVPLELELAVTILEDETRRAIFDMLWRESQNFESDEYGIAFEELRRSVGVESSSRLSYHLERMRAPGEQFEPKEAKSEEVGPETDILMPGSTRSQLVVQQDGQYALDLDVAHRIVQLWALSQPEHETTAPTEVPWVCPYCDRGLIATYRNHRLDLWCDEHGSVFHGSMLPGNAEGQSATDLVHLAALDKARDWTHLLEGFCMACWGLVDGTVVSHQHDETPMEDVLDETTTFPHQVGEHTYANPDAGQFEPVGFARNCRNCNFNWVPGLGVLTCYRSTAVAFFADQGINIYTEPMVWRFVTESGTVRCIDPLRVEVTLTANEKTCTLIVDDDCQVI